MKSARHYYITTLPALGDLGTSPEMGLADLLEHLEENRSWYEQVEGLVLLDDLLQREALLAGETDEVEPSVLSFQQVRGEAPLPEALEAPMDADELAAVDPPTALVTDLLWDRYFRHVHRLGRSHRSRFLVQWVQFEVTLRNALATARARRLGLDESHYLVAPDLAQSGEDLAPMLAEWEAAPTPLAGLRVVIRARWSWLDQQDAWFSFAVDEVLAYAARVMLLEQWLRTEAKEEVQA
jgi:hypothetical protein